MSNLSFTRSLLDLYPFGISVLSDSNDVENIILCTHLILLEDRE